MRMHECVQEKEKEASQITKEGASEEYISVPSLPKPRLLVVGCLLAGIPVPWLRHVCVFI